MQVERVQVQRKVYEFDLDGDTFQVRRPTVDELREFAEPKDDKNADDALFSLLDKCGFPESKARSIDIDLVNQITDIVIPKKKN
jgi:hypothetical protein